MDLLFYSQRWSKTLSWLDRNCIPLPRIKLASALCWLRFAYVKGKHPNLSASDKEIPWPNNFSATYNIEKKVLKCEVENEWRQNSETINDTKTWRQITAILGLKLMMVTAHSHSTFSIQIGNPEWAMWILSIERGQTVISLGPGVLWI